MYDDESVYYGQATNDGMYDDVETYGDAGTVNAGAPTAMVLAWALVVGSLVALWAMGAAVFKGSNQS